MCQHTQKKEIKNDGRPVYALAKDGAPDYGPANLEAEYTESVPFPAQPKKQHAGPSMCSNTTGHSGKAEKDATQHHQSSEEANATVRDYPTTWRTRTQIRRAVFQGIATAPLPPDSQTTSHRQQRRSATSRLSRILITSAALALLEEIRTRPPWMRSTT
jgi:hypothetical protein